MVLYYHPDGSGSVMALSDASGTIVEGYTYSAFGQVVVNTSAGIDGDWLGDGIGSLLNVRIANNLIYGNSGGGIRWLGGSGEVVNNTLAVNGVGLEYAGGGMTARNDSFWSNSQDIAGNCIPTYSRLDSTLGEPTNIIDDPCFVNAAAHDYHLQATSPCIDTGDPAYSPATGEMDIDGDDRIINGRVDMGADEYGE